MYRGCHGPLRRWQPLFFFKYFATMDLYEKRCRVIESLIAHQQAIADTARKEMDSAQQQSNDYGQNVDRYDSFRTKMMRARDMYARQYSNANESIRYLQELLKVHEVPSAVEHGCVVVTDKQRFFLSIGAGKFVVPDAEGEVVFFAVSAQVPIAVAMKGKAVGEKFSFNGVTHTIVEIF